MSACKDTTGYRYVDHGTTTVDIYYCLSNKHEKPNRSEFTKKIKNIVKIKTQSGSIHAYTNVGIPM